LFNETMGAFDGVQTHMHPSHTRQMGLV